MTGKTTSKYDNLLQRVFEILPGLLIWILLLSPIWAGFSIPLLIINVFLLLTVYWLYRACLLAIGALLGYFQYREDVSKNWIKEIQNLDRNEIPNINELPEDLIPNQLIVIANYGEDYHVLSRSIKAIMKQNYPKEKLYLAVSIEERKAKKDEDYAKRGQYLKEDFGNFFGDRLLFFVHPDNIEGEAIGAAANRAWGTKNSVLTFESRGLDISEFLITAPDGDIVFHKEYLAAMAYKWIVAKNRNQKFYQTAMYTFNNNYWDVPILIRILSTSLTIPILSSSVLEKFRRETFSCYSLNLKVMKDVNYWDTSLAIDDTTFYWRPYLKFNGDWHCEVFYVPLLADATHDPNYIKNHIDQYKQYVRWGWGVISFPIAMKILLNRKNRINPIERFYKIYHLFEVFILYNVMVVLLTIGVPIVLILNSSLNDLVISVTIPKIISSIMTFATFLIFPITILKLLIIPNRPDGMSRIKFIFLMLLEVPLNFVVLMTFSFLPFIDASTRMMLGYEHAKSITWSTKKKIR